MARPKEFDEQEVLQKRPKFLGKGFNGASMQDLVEAMGINRASLYDTFGDKQRLYLSCLHQYRDSTTHTMSDETLHSLSVRDRLRALFGAVIDQAVNDPDRKGCFVTNAALERASQDPETRQLVCRNLDFTEQLFRELVEKGQKTGEINRELSAPALAQYWLALMAGFRVLGKVNPDRAALEGLLDVALRVLD